MKIEEKLDILAGNDLQINRETKAEILSRFTALSDKVKELEKQISGIVTDKIQPCGCQVCFCEGDTCNGCGAKLCQDVNCNVRKGILTYSKHPLIATLQDKVKELEEKLKDEKTHSATSDFCFAEWKKQFDEIRASPLINNLTAEKASLKKEVEGLKCCGNCVHCEEHNEYCEHTGNFKPYSEKCNYWQSDKLTREERNG